MIIGNKGVKYGLTVPQAKQKAKVPAVKPLNVFGEDEDSGGEAQAVEREIVRQGAKKLADSKVSLCLSRHKGPSTHSWCDMFCACD